MFQRYFLFKTMYAFLLFHHKLGYAVCVLRQGVQSGSGTPSHINWLAGTFTTRVKHSKSEANHSPTSSVEVKKCVDPHLHLHSWFSAKLSKGITLLSVLRHAFHNATFGNVHITVCTLEAGFCTGAYIQCSALK